MPTRRRTRRETLLAGLGLFAGSAAPAARATQAVPAGPVLLEVSGDIGVTNVPGRMLFDRAMLEALPQTGFTTVTPWLDGPARFDGVAGATLLSALGARARAVHARALNDYSVTIPGTDFDPGGVLIAMRLDGAALPIRARGPLWIVYDYGSHRRFRDETYYSRSIWQLRWLDIRA